MANATPDRVGQINNAGDAKALFLKVFSGEVLTAFAENNVFADKHMVRTISSGKSAQFPTSWKFAAEYHTPGAEILGSSMEHAERVISIDDLLIAHTFIANIDEAMNHYDVRGEYSKQLGAALARAYDKNVAQVGVLAAREAATMTSSFGGSELVNAAYANDGQVIASGIYAAAQAMDEKDVPESDRSCFLKPAQYYVAVQHTDNLNKDWGGAGSFSKGELPEIGGVKIVKTNNLPTTNVNTGPANYQGDFSTTVGLIMNKSAVGTVKLKDLKMESEYDIRRQGTLMVSSYAMGHGILRPECAVELKTL